MGCVVVLGEPPAVLPWALAGAVVAPARTPDAVRAAWDALPDGTDVVIVTRRAAQALGPRPDGPAVVVLP